MGVASSIFRGLGDMRYPARMMIVGSLIQVPLSGALVLGYFGAPKLGLFGAAVSVIITSAVTAPCLLSLQSLMCSVILLVIIPEIFQFSKSDDQANV